MSHVQAGSFRILHLARGDYGEQRVARLQCVDCPASLDLAVPHVRPNTDWLARRAARHGWSVHPQRWQKVRCPRCAGPRRKCQSDIPAPAVAEASPPPSPPPPAPAVAPDAAARMAELLTAYFTTGRGRKVAELDALAETVGGLRKSLDQVEAAIGDARAAAVELVGYLAPAHPRR